jgi:hypothetical protein
VKAETAPAPNYRAGHTSRVPRIQQYLIHRAQPGPQLSDATPLAWRSEGALGSPPMEAQQRPPKRLWEGQEDAWGGEQDEFSLRLSKAWDRMQGGQQPGQGGKAPGRTARMHATTAWPEDRCGAKGVGMDSLW